MNKFIILDNDKLFMELPLFIMHIGESPSMAFQKLQLFQLH